MIKIGINGFGRIGRLILRASINNPLIEVVAINSRADEKTSAYLFKYDSIHNIFCGNVTTSAGEMIINNKKIKMFKEKNPSDINWSSVGTQIVLESTGVFNLTDKASEHINGTVKKVIITSPSKNGDITIILGVNENKYDPEIHNIISNSSCTTNCLAPVAKVLNDNFNIIRGFMTTIHSYTNDQRLLDKTHKDLRRSRASALSIIPTSTGATTEVGVVLPELKGKLDGISMRVPTPNVSVVDLVAELNTNVSPDKINSSFKKASESSLRGILEYIDEPLVSKDFNGNSFSAVFDSLLTMTIKNNMIKVFAWYDNEYGYANRCIDLAIYIGKKGI